MSTSAIWMLAVTWSVILYFSISLLWRVLRLDRDAAPDDDPDDL